MLLSFDGIVRCDGTDNDAVAEALKVDFMKSIEERGVVVVDDVMVDIMMALVSRSTGTATKMASLRMDLICLGFRKRCQWAGVYVLKLGDGMTPSSSQDWRLRTLDTCVLKM